MWLALKFARYYRKGKVTWRTDLSLDPRQFRKIIDRFERLLYLRDPEEETHDLNEINGDPVATQARDGETGGEPGWRHANGTVEPDVVSPAVIATGSHHDTERQSHHPGRYADAISLENPRQSGIGSYS